MPRTELEKTCSQALSMSKQLARKGGYVACLASLEEVVAAWGENCDLCGVNHDRLARGLHMDHCHKTGRFRGWLCARCNSALGRFSDDPDMLRRAIAYLEGELVTIT